MSARIMARSNSSLCGKHLVLAAGCRHSWDCQSLFSSIWCKWLPILFHGMVVSVWANFLDGNWLPRSSQDAGQEQMTCHLFFIQWVQTGPRASPDARGRDCIKVWNPRDVVPKDIPKHRLTHTSTFNVKVVQNLLYRILLYKSELLTSCYSCFSCLLCTSNINSVFPCTWVSLESSLTFLSPRPTTALSAYLDGSTLRIHPELNNSSQEKYNYSNCFFINQDQPIRLTRNHSNETKAPAEGKWGSGIRNALNSLTVSEGQDWDGEWVQTNQTSEKGLVELEC